MTTVTLFLGSFVKYVTRKGGGGSSVVLRSCLKTWVKCGKPVTIGRGRGQKRPKIALRILRMTPFVQLSISILIWYSCLHLGRMKGYYILAYNLLFRMLTYLSLLRIVETPSTVYIGQYHPRCFSIFTHCCLRYNQ